MGDTLKGDPETSDTPITTADLAGAPVKATAEPANAQEQGYAPLLTDDEASNLRQQWDKIQTGFVDEPRRAVENADTLVAETMQRLAETFASERSSLERQWDGGETVSTEDLRVTLQRYRAFFGRLLAV